MSTLTRHLNWLEFLVYSKFIYETKRSYYPVLALPNLNAFLNEMYLFYNFPAIFQHVLHEYEF